MRISPLPSSIKRMVSEDARILAVLLFGSRARGEPYRDTDLCIVLNKKHQNKEMTNIAIRYSGSVPDEYDISVFQQLPLYIRQRVLKDGKVLLCKNFPLLYDIAFQTMKEFNLYEKLYRRYLHEVEKRTMHHAR